MHSGVLEAAVCGSVMEMAETSHGGMYKCCLEMPDH